MAWHLGRTDPSSNLISRSIAMERARSSLDDSDQLRRSRAGRHEVDESHRAALCVVLTLEDERPRTIAALDFLDLGCGRSTQRPWSSVSRSAAKQAAESNPPDAERHLSD
jgi:hypothetical protein